MVTSLLPSAFECHGIYNGNEQGRRISSPAQAIQQRFVEARVMHEKYATGEQREDFVEDYGPFVS